MPIATNPFATTPFSAQDITIVSLSGNQLNLSLSDPIVTAGGTIHLPAGAPGMVLTLGQETGRIAPGNLGQQLNLSVNWNPTDFLVCN